MAATTDRIHATTLPAGRRLRTLAGTAAGLTMAMLAGPAAALEYPIGSPQSQSGMEVGAVYLQAIDMEPDGHMRRAAESDIHLEADIHALANNPNGFPEGSWMPHLLVRYELAKVSGGSPIKGDMMPMVASDGPHYGDNVKLQGPGRYKVKFLVYPPNARENPQGNHFGRHTDRATGVRPWFKPFELEWEFTYAGIGKKGGY